MLEKVEFSEWATPIVPVLKPDGSVRICGDYSMTINPVLEVHEYPMQTAHDIFCSVEWWREVFEVRFVFGLPTSTSGGRIKAVRHN